MIPEQGKAHKVGDRIDVGGEKGTIKYIGNVAGTKGEWLGIEWDDATRGKHSGIHDGVKYFTTKCLNSGSFIRPAKVSQTLSCVDAIQIRYGLVEENAGIDLNSLAQVQKDIKAKVFEVVGAEKINKKQSQFDNLQLVSLRGQPIIDGGPPQALHLLCHNIRELDVSKTLITKWSVAAAIAAQLPHLRLLNLSENKLEIDEVAKRDAFKMLDHLVVGKADLTWPQVLKCCNSLPNLKILQVPFNNIDHLSHPELLPMGLTSLDIEGNNIKNWQEINKLDNLAHLETLNVSCCGLENIIFEEKCNMTSKFSSLQRLLISENFIADWLSISELDKLKSLFDLKFSKNPILNHESIETNYQIIIARIKNLKILNGQLITVDERRGAELDFLKRHGLEYLEISNDSDRAQFFRLYPCYQRLLEAFGPPEKSELTKPSCSLKQNLIQINIYPFNNPEFVCKKKVPLTMTVQKLCGLVQRLFDTGSEVPRLYYQHSLKDCIEVELDNELKDLNYFSLEDGACITVRW